jgi:hypothetical protein
MKQRINRRFTLTTLFILYFGLSIFPLYAQIDPRKIDSLKRHIDSSAQAVKTYQDSFKKRQDSIYYAQVNRQIEQNMRNSHKYAQELEAQRKRQTYIRIGIGIIFLALLALGLIRQRKKTLH